MGNGEGKAGGQTEKDDGRTLTEVVSCKVDELQKCLKENGGDRTKCEVTFSALPLPPSRLRSLPPSLPPPTPLIQLPFRLLSSSSTLLRLPAYAILLSLLHLACLVISSPPPAMFSSRLVSPLMCTGASIPTQSSP
eukprot:747126-Hanusia_phi.AAC.1